MPSRTRWVSASEIVEEFGFTTRHWIRMAASGRVPGARQPFGPRSSWIFDLNAVRAWWASTEKKPEPSGTVVSAKARTRHTKMRFERADLKKTLAKVLAEHPLNRKR